MKNIINKIKNLTLEGFNKNLFLFALVFLLFRIGNFSISYLPKPFEIIFALVLFLTTLDIIINNKFSEFFLSIPKNIRIAMFILVSSILLGWAFSTFFLNIPFYFNMVLEFGTFTISFLTFLLILFFTRNDETYIKKCLYTLLIPSIYIICILFPSLASDFNLITYGNHFIGFTTNPNTLSKILLIPVLFFTSISLFDVKDKFFKVGYMLVSSFLVTLILWATSRGAFLSLLLGSIFLIVQFMLNDFSYRKLFKTLATVLVIFLVGFILTSHNTKNLVSDRIYNTKIDLYHISPKNKLQENFINESGTQENQRSLEPRFRIWAFYLEKVLINPFGYGPNTHMPSNISDNNGGYENSGPHNTFLQIWLWGGLLGLLSFLYIFINVFKHLKEKLKQNFNSLTVSLSAILFGLSVSIMFDDSLSFYWFFIILALAYRI